MKNHLCLIVSIALSTTAHAQLRPTAKQDIRRGVVVYVPTTQAATQLDEGEVRVYDELTGDTLAADGTLRRLRLLAIDFNGRVKLDALRSDRPQLFDVGPGATRIELTSEEPGEELGEGGSLYRYARTSDGGERYGFLWIDGRGRAHVRAERAAVAGADPFVQLVALSRDGGRFLVATTFAAGGDLLEVTLATGVVQERTTNLPPLVFSGHGLALGDGFGVGVNDRGVVRFSDDPAGLAEPVLEQNGTFPAWMSGEVVLSNNGQWAATTAGYSSHSAHVFVFGAAGFAQRVNEAGARIAGAGFLPESLNGPYLAVSDDGTAAAWCTDGVTRELFCARIAAVTTPVEVTRDANFIDTLDEVGTVGFVTPTTLVAAVGEGLLGPGPALERFDLHTISVPRDGSEPTIVSLTQSSGDTEAPILAPPTIKPEDNLFFLPEVGAYLLHDAQFDRLAVTYLAQPGTVTLLEDVKSLDAVRRVAGELVLAVERMEGSQPIQLLCVDASLSNAPVLLFAADEGASFGTLVARRRGEPTLAALVEHETQDADLVRVRVRGGVAHSVPGAAAPFGSSFGFTPRGGLAFVASELSYVWSEGTRVPMLLNAPVSQAVILP